MTNDKWSELEAAAKAATLGKWKREGAAVGAYFDSEIQDEIAEFFSDDDAIFVAAANPQVILRLLEERRALADLVREAFDAGYMAGWIDGESDSAYEGENLSATSIAVFSRHTVKAELDRITGGEHG